METDAELMARVMHTIPEYTAYPSKTRAYGTKTRFEILRKRNAELKPVRVWDLTIFREDQPTRKGRTWAYENLILAEAACHKLNFERARRLIIVRGIESENVPNYFETHARVLMGEGDFEAAAQLFLQAKAASVGHTRRQGYDEMATTLRQLDVIRMRGKV